MPLPWTKRLVCPISSKVLDRPRQFCLGLFSAITEDNRYPVVALRSKYGDYNAWLLVIPNPT